MIAKVWNHSCWVEETHPDSVKRLCSNLMRSAEFSVLQVVEHHFEPQGYTILFLLAESHYAAHTFPEQGRTYIELTSCNEAKHQKYLELLPRLFTIVEN